MHTPHRTLPVFLILSLLALALPARADVITGRVVDVLGQGVGGVDIDVKNLGSGGDPTPLNDGTDANGFFTTTLPAGIYRVTFRPPPPPTTSHLVKEVDDVIVVGTTNMGVVSLPPGVTLSGRVVTSTGLPVGGVNLDVIDEVSGDNLTLNATTGGSSDAFGQFAVAVPAGPIELRLDATTVVGLTLASRAIELSPAAATDLGDVVLPPGFHLSATVRGPGGVPLEGVDTDVIDAASGDKLYTPKDNTDENGLVSVVVPAGTWDFVACPTVSTQLVAKQVDGIAVAGDVGLGVLTLQAGFVLSGVVRDGANQPVAGVDVDVENAGTGAPVALCGDNTNGTGAYAVVVPAGTWRVEFSPPYAKPLGEKVVSPVAVGGPKVQNAVLPACPFHVPYGVGLAGSGGQVPLLGTSGGTPRAGNDAYALQLTGARGGALAFFVLSTAPAATPFHGGTLLVSATTPTRGETSLAGTALAGGSGAASVPLVTFVLPLRLGGAPGAPGAGFASVPLPVPNVPQVVGTHHYAQALVVDPAAVDGWALSQGVAITYCD